MNKPPKKDAKIGQMMQILPPPSLLRQDLLAQWLNPVFSGNQLFKEYTLVDLCKELDDKIYELSKRRKFAEKNKAFIIMIDKLTSDGLKERALDILMPKYAKERLALLMDVYSAQDRHLLLDIYQKKGGQALLQHAASLKHESFETLCSLVQLMSTEKALSDFHFKVLVEIIEKDPKAIEKFLDSLKPKKKAEEEKKEESKSEIVKEALPKIELPREHVEFLKQNMIANEDQLVRFLQTRSQLYLTN
jgi:hypothetical protein